MDNKQKINCNVKSCLYNDLSRSKCMLEEISVEPCINCTSHDCDESMCGSYEHAYDDDDEEEGKKEE